MDILPSRKHRLRGTSPGVPFFFPPLKVPTLKVGTEGGSYSFLVPLDSIVPVAGEDWMMKTSRVLVYDKEGVGI